MFKVTICDIGKMNINMTDKIEKKEATFAVPYNGEDNNDYVDDEVVQHIEYVPFGEVFVEERNNITWGIEVSVDYYKRRVFSFSEKR